MIFDRPTKTKCVCPDPIRVHDPDGLGPRCLLCGHSLGGQTYEAPAPKSKLEQTGTRAA